MQKLLDACSAKLPCLFFSLPCHPVCWAVGRYADRCACSNV